MQILSDPDAKQRYDMDRRPASTAATSRRLGVDEIVLGDTVYPARVTAPRDRSELVSSAWIAAIASASLVVYLVLVVQFIKGGPPPDIGSR